MTDTLERDLRLSIALEQTKHLSHEDRVRLAAKLVESVAKADAPDVPSSAFAPVAWASVRLNLAVQCMDRLNESAADFDAEFGDGE